MTPLAQTQGSLFCHLASKLHQGRQGSRTAGWQKWFLPRAMGSVLLRVALLHLSHCLNVQGLGS